MNPRSILRLLLLAAVAGGLGLIGGGAAFAAVIKWDGDAGDGLWITKENWVGDELPMAGDDVIIEPAFSVNHTASTHTIRSLTVDGSLTILGGLLEFTQASQINGTLTMGASQDFPGGTLHGTGPLTIANPLNWFGGTMSGSGVTHANGGISFAGQFGKTLNGRILNSPGTTSWSGQGNLGIGLGAVFLNQGTFDVQNNQSVGFTGGSGATFLNIGTFNKGGGGPTTFGFSVRFDNTGTVNVQGGASLVLFGGGTSDGGTFDSAAGSSVDFRSDTHTLISARFTGAGFGRVSGATVLLTGTVNASNFEVASGNVGGMGSLDVARILRWTGGTMSGPPFSAFTFSQGSLEISGPLGKTLIGRTLSNSGTGAVWTGTGNIGIGGDGALQNFASFRAENDSSVVFAGGNSASFANYGTFTKSVRDGVTSVSAGVFFNNGGGTVDVQTGTLVLAGGGTSGASGTFKTVFGTSVVFNGGTYDLQAGTTFTGDGLPRLMSGTLTVGGEVNARKFWLDAGNLDGPGTLKVAELLHWTGGTMRGTGITEVSGSTEIFGVTGKFLNRRTFVNRGVATWTDTSNIGISALAEFRNEPGARFRIENDQFFGVVGFADGAFVNRGTVTKSIGTGRTTFFSGVAFDNTSGGTVDVMSGTLALAGGGTSLGAFAATGGGASTVEFAGGTHFLIGATFTGDGFALVSGGTADLGAEVTADNFWMTGGALQGQGNLTVAGLFLWNGGTMLGAGQTASNGTLFIFGSAAKTLNGRDLSNAGRATWTGSGITIGNGSVLRNLSGAIFDAQNDVTVGFGPGSFANAGTFTKSGGTGATTFSPGVPFNNTGTVNAQSGTIAFFGGFNQTGGQINLAGGNIAGAVNSQMGGIVGSGLINGQVFNGGAVKPGKSPGAIQIVGDYTQGASGEFEAEIGGTTAGQFDQLAVSGAANLAGTLNIVLINGFQPIVGDSFPILTYGSVSGAFDTVNVLGLAGARTFGVTYGPSGLMLVTQGAAGSADISVTKTHSPDSPLVGHDLTYTITVTNNGPDAASGVTVGDGLPAEVSFVSAFASQGSCSGTTVVTCDVGSLSSGSQATVTIVVRPTATGMITNTVSVASDQSDPAPGNNQAMDVVSMTGSNGPFAFYTLIPCRVLDTRLADGPLGGPALAANTDRSFALAGACGIPPTAKAVSANVTVTQPASQGHLSLYPAGSGLPLVSSINFGPGQTRANNATLPLGVGGAITVRSALIGGTVHFILDVNGYYE